MTSNRFLMWLKSALLSGETLTDEIVWTMDKDKTSDFGLIWADDGFIVKVDDGSIFKVEIKKVTLKKVKVK